MTVPGFPLGDPQLQSAAASEPGHRDRAARGLHRSPRRDSLSRWSGLTDLTAICIQIMPPRPLRRHRRAPAAAIRTRAPTATRHGHAYGVELLVRRPLSKRLSGWLSYTLSRSTRQAHFVTPAGRRRAGHGRQRLRSHPRPERRPAYDLGRHWRAGRRVVFYTGSAVLQPGRATCRCLPTTPTATRRSSAWTSGSRSAGRWARTGSIAFIIEGQNVTLSKRGEHRRAGLHGNRRPRAEPVHCRADWPAHHPQRRGRGFFLMMGS